MSVNAPATYLETTETLKFASRDTVDNFDFGRLNGTASPSYLYVVSVTLLFPLDFAQILSMVKEQRDTIKRRILSSMAMKWMQRKMDLIASR